MRSINFFTRFLIVGIVLFSFNNCSNSKVIDAENEKNRILELHNAERKYHFEKLAKELVDLQSDDFTTINAGEILKPTKEEGVNMFSNYFSSVEFESWDDIVEPIIKFSDDYTIAYVTVKKKVVINFKDKNGNNLKESSQFAWVSVYKKSNDIWKLDLIASTNKPRTSQ